MTPQFIFYSLARATLLGYLIDETADNADGSASFIVLTDEL